MAMTALSEALARIEARLWYWASRIDQRINNNQEENNG